MKSDAKQYANKSDMEILSNAVMRAAKMLGMSNRDLASVIGVSPSFVGKLQTGASLLKWQTKEAELGLHFVRLFRSLDAIVGGDDQTSQKWLRNHNTALGQVPLNYIKSISGLIDT